MENAEQILFAASSMELVQLRKQCADLLIEHVDVGSCVDLMLVADRHNLVDLNKKSFNCIRNNYNLIAMVDLVRIDEKNFEAILQSDKIYVIEDKVFENLVQWIQHDDLNRSKLIAPFAHSIRLKHVSKEVKRNKVRKKNVPMFHSN